MKIVGLGPHLLRERTIVEAIAMMITLLARVAIDLAAQICPRPGMLDPLLTCRTEDSTKIQE